jgi:dihydroneopterin aldolase
MMSEGVVALEGMEFYAQHGYYAEERVLGNKYTVDVFIHLDFSQAAVHDKLEGTINYERVYQIIAEVMSIDTLLLEHLAAKMIKAIGREFPVVEKVRIKVSKHDPPIKGLCQKASVELSSSSSKTKPLPSEPS